jgi:cysteine desulfurase/selenocysteine lyase
MTTPTLYDVHAIRAQFPILSREVHGKPLAYFDSAASAQKPQAVIDAQARYLSHTHSNIHRGVHALAQEATEAYEGAREIVRAHLGAASTREILFVGGTTDGINLVAQTWGRANLGEGDCIVLTRMEHHSNIVPWQMLALDCGFDIHVVELNPDGTLDGDQFEQHLARGPKLVAFTHVSNALGTVNDVKHWTTRAHDAGATVLVDGAQSVPHLAVNVQELGVDFYTFSGHKTYGPTGIGILYGREALLDAMPPWRGGGEMIGTVSFENGTTYNELPYKFEAGTPHISGGVALGAALDWMNGVGMASLTAHEHVLTQHAHAQLESIDGMRFIGTAPCKAGVVSFLIEGVHPYDLGTLLDQLGIAVRTGHHCTEPLMDKLGIPGTVRASFGAYNTVAEIDRLAEAVARAAAMLR